MKRRAVAMAVLACALAVGAQEPPELALVATERQLGPVAYRDPIGVPSPDGRWLATTSGLHLYLRPLVGGPIRELGPGTMRVNELVWVEGTLYAHESNYARTWSDWFAYDPASGERRSAGPLGPVPTTVAGAPEGIARPVAVSADGDAVALVVPSAAGSSLWRYDPGTGELRHVVDRRLIHAVAWAPTGTLACVHGAERELTLDCVAGAPVARDVYREFVVAPDGAVVFARPDDGGTLDLWRLGSGGAEHRLTRFSRDAYAPYLLHDGSIVFRVQDYRIFVATVPAAGGEIYPVTAFQSETPSWDRDGSRVAFTYGSWRRIIDDAHYPDISQHVGVVALDDGAPAAAPQVVVRSSYSEDQGMHWSPDGRWIVLHSHADGTDDLWLQPADGSGDAWPITTGGHETGWPRWSPDGRTIIYPTELDDGTGRLRGTLMTLGVDPASAEVVRPAAPLTLDGYEGSVNFAEFAPDGRSIYFESHDGVGRRSLRRVALDGGVVETIHEYESEQWYSAIGVSPDDAWLAFIAPGTNGRFQVFRVPTAGGEPEQLTFDDTDKTHPTWSPRGDRIAFSVFRYESAFWRLTR